jgi:hypothetical protein
VTSVAGRGRLAAKVRELSAKDELEAMQARLSVVDEAASEHHHLERRLAEEVDRLERLVLERLSNRTE